jgi:2-phospho-L-lactate/phosphoenolpyruvate guanylyltransferase
MRTLAVLPVKSFGRAKQRLGGGVAAIERQGLAEAMASDVLDALRGVRGLEGVIVVTAASQQPPSAPAVEFVEDPVEAGQSAAGALGIGAAVARGAERVLLVPGDCPALDPGEVDDLLATHAPGVTIVADRHGSGTNALLIAPPDALAPAFGPGSFARHAALARAGGATVRVAHLPSLELDVDTPEDLEALRAALAARPGGAARTRERLERLVPSAA